MGFTAPGHTSPACGAIGVTSGLWPNARCAVSLVAGGALGLPNGQSVSAAKCRVLAQPDSNKIKLIAVTCRKFISPQRVGTYVTEVRR